MSAPSVLAFSKFDGWVERGGQNALSSMNGSTIKVQGSYPGASVSVVLTGTATPASLFSTAVGTSKANPFTASSTGYYIFYAGSANCYDLTFSGGGIVTPYTIANVCAIGSSSSSSSGGIDITACGAIPDDGIDDTASIQTCLTAAQSTGTGLHISPGKFDVTSATSPIFNVTKPIHIFGDGKVSWIAATAGTSTSVDVFQYKPGTGSGVDTDGFTIEDLRITGTSASARRGIFINANEATKFVRKFVIRHVFLEDLGGDDIYLDSQTASGGFGIFTSKIEDVIIGVAGAGTNSCIRGVNLLDSIIVKDSTLTGTGYSLKLDWLPGAGLFQASNNNCTASSGAYFGSGVGKLILTGNFFEQNVPFTGSDTAMVDIDGAGGFPQSDAVIENNIFSVIAGNTADGLRLNNTLDAVIEKNEFNPVAGRSGIVLTANAARTFIKATNHFSGVGTNVTNSSNSAIGDTLPLYLSIADSTAVANTVTPTIFSKSYSIVANQITSPCVAIDLMATGKYSNTGTPTILIEFLVGGFIFGGVTSTTALGAVDFSWSANTRAVFRTVGGGALVALANGNGGALGAVTQPLAGLLTTAINTAAPIACQVRVTWSAADPANTTLMRSFSVIEHQMWNCN